MATELTPLLGGEQRDNPFLDIDDSADELQQRTYDTGVKSISRRPIPLGQDPKRTFQPIAEAFAKAKRPTPDSDSGVEKTPSPEMERAMAIAPTEDFIVDLEQDAQQQPDVVLDLSDHPEIKKLREEMKDLKKKDSPALTNSFRALTTAAIGLQVYNLYRIATDFASCDDNCQYTPEEIGLYACTTVLSVIGLARSFFS